MSFKPFNPKPYDPARPYKPRSAAQNAALRILRMRGLYYQAGVLSPDGRRIMKALIDAELERLGVETQTARDNRRWAELEKEDRT